MDITWIWILSYFGFSLRGPPTYVFQSCSFQVPDQVNNPLVIAYKAVWIQQSGHLSPNKVNNPIFCFLGEFFIIFRGSAKWAGASTPRRPLGEAGFSRLWKQIIGDGGHEATGITEWGRGAGKRRDHGNLSHLLVQFSLVPLTGLGLVSYIPLLIYNGKLLCTSRFRFGRVDNTQLMLMANCGELNVWSCAFHPSPIFILHSFNPHLVSDRWAVSWSPFYRCKKTISEKLR